METSKKFIVTKKAMRPASEKRECFYCGAFIGEPHGDKCVLIQKKVKIRAIVEYEINVPCHWGKNDVEFSRNESSWCAGNFVSELSEIQEEKFCLCGNTEFKFISSDNVPFLRER